MWEVHVVVGQYEDVFRSQNEPKLVMDQIYAFTDENDYVHRVLSGHIFWKKVEPKSR